MDISRLKKNNLQVWLALFDDVEILCNHISQRQFEALRAEHTRVRFDPKTHQRREELDEEAFRCALARAVVADWRGLENDGEPFACTVENIDYLMTECTEFRLLVMNTPLSLERMLAAEREDTEKNSQATSAPDTTTPA